MKAEVLRLCPGTLLGTRDGQDAIRDVVRRKFVFRETEGYKALGKEYRDILSIVEGMLKNDPLDRWTASRAYEECVRIAHKRGVSVPPPRKPPPDLQRQWRAVWQ